jgi:hypothetical protein
MNSGLLELSEALDDFAQKAIAQQKNDTAVLDDNQVQWSSPLGKVTFSFQGFGLGNPRHMQWVASYSSVDLRGHKPNRLTIHMKCEPAEGVKVFNCWREKRDSKVDVRPVTGDRIDPYSIRIRWQGHVPIVEKEFIDMDFVFLSQRGDETQGMFTQFQPSIKGRKGKFWLGLQEVYRGHVLHTTSRGAEKAKKRGYSTREVDGKIGIVLPVTPEHAYPGCDFLKVPGFVHEIVDIALREGSTLPMSKTRPAEWMPEKAELRPRDKQMMRPKSDKEVLDVGTVLWFNLDTGYGSIRCSDGKNCFVHFKQIFNSDYRLVIDEGEYPILRPMAPVAVLYGPGENNRERDARMVVPLSV